MTNLSVRSLIFSGHHNSKLNSKNQVTLPSDLRAVFFDAESDHADLILFTRQASEYVQIYTRPAWEAKLQKVMERASELRDNQLLRVFNRYVNTQEIKKSGNGRILIPQEFLDKFPSRDEITFIGMGNFIEVWDERIYTNQQSELDGANANYESELADLMDFNN